MSSTYRGILEPTKNGTGIVREKSLTFAQRPSDPYVKLGVIRQYRLRPGVEIEGELRPGKRGVQIKTVNEVNGLSAEQWREVTEFSELTVISPTERLVLETGKDDVSMRVVDLICPIGKGQRALIVSPPRAGKTVLMQQMANSIATNYPEVDIVVLLVDERPEEVTEMRRGVQGEVFASCNDHPASSHVRLAKLATEYAKRRVEAGRDVVMFLDSITRLGRAFNSFQRGTGRTLTGGIDAGALEIPRAIFGSARNIEDGGSLTIIATALVETGSRMDDFIFEEFKGTGNMELVLNRDLANQRIFPAINVAESGTRKEHLLLGDDTPRHHALIRHLNEMKPREAMETLLGAIGRSKSNAELLRSMSIR